MDEIRRAITAALPSFRSKFRFDTDPMFVGAVGAAFRAKRIVDMPELLIEKIDITWDSHDEL